MSPVPYDEALSPVPYDHGVVRGLPGADRERVPAERLDVIRCGYGRAERETSESEKGDAVSRFIGPFR
jgi:hypothetical protein